MNDTIERRISDANDAITVRLDDLESTLPAIPSKALAASRASVRRVNDIVESAASSIRNRFEHVADDTATAVKTTTGQAKAASGRVNKTVRDGVAETTGQARAATVRATKTVKDGVAQTTGQARTATGKVTKTVKSGVKQSTGQAKAQARKVTTSVAAEVEGALDDAKVATDPDRYAEMTKAELYDRATTLDIEGRSGMTKAELVGAIQKA